MNYEALDEALEYIEYKNSDEVVNEDTVLWVLGGIFATLFAAIAAYCGIVGSKYRKEGKRIQEAVKDPKIQAILKKLVESMQKDIMNYPDFKKYIKFVKPLSYKYDIVNSYHNPEVDNVAIKFPFLQFDMEAIFKAAMGTDMESYDDGYWEIQPDNCRPAPKFRKYVKEMLKAAKSYGSSINKKTKKCKASIDADYSDARELDSDLEIFYDSWWSGHGGEDFTISITLEFDKEDFVNKTVE